MAELTEQNAVFRALAENDEDALRRAIAAGADVNASSTHPAAAEGMTPLHLAASLGNGTLMHLLLQAGAEPNARHSSTQETPLHAAVSSQSLICARLLLEAGANVNARCALGMTPLDNQNENTWYPGSEMLRLLRSHGGKPGAEMESLTVHDEPEDCLAAEGINWRRLLWD